MMQLNEMVRGYGGRHAERGDGAAARDIVRPQVTDDFDDDCTVDVPRPWLRIARSAQTESVGNNDDTESIHGSFPASPWPKMPLGTTDGLQPGPVGLSRRLVHRCGRRVRRRRHEEEPLAWSGVVAVVLLGLLTAMSAVATWAFLTAVAGVSLLVADRHFWWPVCAALSLNFWSAVAWIAWAVSLDVGVVLALLAFALRGSVLLFMDPGESLLLPMFGDLFRLPSGRPLNREQRLARDIENDRDRLLRAGGDMAGMMWCSQCTRHRPTSHFSNSQRKKNNFIKKCHDCRDRMEEVAREPVPGMEWCSRCRRKRLSSAFSQSQRKKKTDRDRKCNVCLEAQLNRSGGARCSQCRRQCTLHEFSRSQLEKKSDVNRKCRECVLEHERHLEDCLRIKEQERVISELEAEAKKPLCEICASLLWSRTVVQCPQCEQSLHQSCFEQAGNTCPFCRSVLGCRVVDEPAALIDLE